MITGLFINACILVTFTSIYHSFLKSKYKSTPSLLLKVLVGVTYGLLGMILIKFSVKTSTIIIDLRYLPILLCAISEGALSSIIASIIIGSFHILYFGITSLSITSLIEVLLIGVGISIISSSKKAIKYKWIYSIIYILIFTFIFTVIIAKVAGLIFKITSIYTAVTIIVAYFLFRYTEYLSDCDDLYLRLKSEATVDFLTGLNNVRQFDISFNTVSQQIIEKHESLSLLYIDIDYFKRINDTYGHSSGDIILKSLATILTNTCKYFDIISRNGGEEFLILLLNCSSLNAFKIAEIIRKNVESNKFYISDKVNIEVTISIGISTYPDTTNNIDNLLEYADTALYKAKKTGRNKVCIYDPQ